MGQILYGIITGAYFLGIKIASLWSEKARLWIKGRVGGWEFYESKIAQQRVDNQQLVWMHCASLGEFEQGRPVLEALRKQYPQVQILLTFFSPSGYEIRKNYPVADWVGYLPADGAANAQRFLNAIKPDLAIFVKYEFWFHYLHHLRQRSIPTLLIAAIFRPSQPFFKWYGGLHRKMLSCFSSIMVQDVGSAKLLERIGLQNVTVSGDTRVDRVAEIAAQPVDLPLVKQFCGDSPVLVCGSTWPADEAILKAIFEHEKFRDWKFILAPHEVQDAHLQAIESDLTVLHVRYSKLKETTNSNVRLLLVDNIGLLSSLYAFGQIAYIGGGFGRGIHNTLEPAAHGLPVVFGPKYQKFEEAKWMVEKGGAFVVENKRDMVMLFERLLDVETRRIASKWARNYIEQKSGGTAIAMKYVSRSFLG